MVKHLICNNFQEYCFYPVDSLRNRYRETCYVTCLIFFCNTFFLESGGISEDSDVCDMQWPSSPISHPSIESETVLIEAAARPPSEAATIPYTHNVCVVPDTMNLDCVCIDG